MNIGYYRLVKHLQSINTNPDKVISYFYGECTDYKPAVMIKDLSTDEICMWWGKLTNVKYRAMLTEVKTDYLHLSSVLSK